MSKGHPRPRWWVLYLGCGVILGLFWREITIPLTQTEHTLVEIGLVLLLYGWTAVWLNANAGALLLEEEERRRHIPDSSHFPPSTVDHANEQVVGGNGHSR